MQLLWLILMCHITLRNNRLCLNISTFSLFSFFSIFLHVKSELQQRLTTSLFFPQCCAVGAVVCALSVVLKLRVPLRLLPYKSTRASFRESSSSEGWFVVDARRDSGCFCQLWWCNASFFCIYWRSPGYFSFFSVSAAHGRRAWKPIFPSARRVSGAAACPASFAAPSCILYAQHAAPVLPNKAHLRVRAPWPAPAAFTERHGSQTAPDKEPEKLPGDRRSEPGSGRRRRRRRGVSSRLSWNGDGLEDPESHRVQGGGPSLLQGEEVPGSDRQVPPGAAAAQRGSCRGRHYGLRGQPAQPSRGQADRGAEESRGEHRDRVLRQPDRWHDHKHTKTQKHPDPYYSPSSADTIIGSGSPGSHKLRGAVVSPGAGISRGGRNNTGAEMEHGWCLFVRFLIAHTKVAARCLTIGAFIYSGEVICQPEKFHRVG